MNKNRIMEKPELFQWIEMLDKTEPEGIRERCARDYITKNFNAYKKLRKYGTFRKMEIAGVELFDQGVYSEGGQPEVGDLPAFCKVTLTSSIGGGNIAKIKVFLPLLWNGRLLLNTGGGSSSEQPYFLGEPPFWGNTLSVVRALRNYFVTVTNDNSFDNNAKWGFKEGTDELDWNLIMNWAYLGNYDMTLVARVLSEIVYGEAPAYTYIAGASAGGRQTIDNAQLYPELFDGALATHPATPWAPHHVSEGWPYFVLNNEHHQIPRAKFEAMRTAILEQYGCVDKQYVDSTYTIDFDFYSLLGRETDAGPFTEEDCRVLKKIYDGPTYSDGRKMPDCDRLDPVVRIWRADIPLGQIAVEEDGSIGESMTVRMRIIRQIFSWITREPDLQLQDITYEDLDYIYDKGKAELKFADGQNVDMRGLKNRGSKVIYTVPTGDGFTPHDISRRFYKDVVRFFGVEETNRFFKFYYTYGGQHTFLNDWVFGDQLALADSMRALMRWVEEGIEPQEIEAMGWDHVNKCPVITGKVLPYSVMKESK